jgi:transposase-like protein
MTNMGTLPLRCPDCRSHGWVTLVTEIFSGSALHWRCTNCHHEWAAVDSTDEVGFDRSESEAFLVDAW